MKKNLLRIGAVLVSAMLLTACEEKVKDKKDGEVEVTENGSGHEEDIESLTDDEGDENVEGTVISGNIIPGVTGSIKPVEDVEETESGELVNSNISKGSELMALVASEEEAREIAEIYGIELVRFEHGVACYHTEEDPVEVVQRGIDNGWPEIGVNGRSSLVN